MPSNTTAPKNAPGVLQGLPTTPKKSRKRAHQALTPTSPCRASKRLQKGALKENNWYTAVPAGSDDVFNGPAPLAGQTSHFRLKVPKQHVQNAPETFTHTQYLPSAHPSIHKLAHVKAFTDAPMPDASHAPKTSSGKPMQPADAEDDDDDEDDEEVPPEDDELNLLGPGVFPGDGYPRPSPPEDFIAQMEETQRRRLKFSAPTVTDAATALADLNRLMRGEKRGSKSKGYKPLEYDEYVRVRLNGIRTLLSLYTDRNCPSTFECWRDAALVAAKTVGRGAHCARQLARLAREFIINRKVLPINPYGKWTLSMLSDEELASDVQLYLRQLGDHITAEKLVNYLSRQEVMEKHDIGETISVRTARRYLDELGYTFSHAKKGQYADGHEREDVVQYRDQEYLPALKAFTDRTAYWEEDGTLVLPILSSDKPQRVIIWYHDESIFYAHDRRQKTWRFRDAGAKPYQKGEGHSFMVADYVSADFGWLRGQNGESARRTMRPGKNRDGYFTSAEVEEQALTACSIVKERWPEFEHVFVYDNATTHHKRSNGALSARGMPMKISGFISEATEKRQAKKAAKEAAQAAAKGGGTDGEIEGDEEEVVATTVVPDAAAVGGKKKRKPRKAPEDTNFLVQVNARNKDGSLRYDVHGKLEKEEIQMKGAHFKDGTEQDLYLPETHKRYPGKFKGMLNILEERRERGDLGDSITQQSLEKLRAECPKFKCTDPTSHTCCIRRMLYNQPDFAEVSSCLETACASFGITILFLPKFHPELNPIEMCWGYAKRIYRLNPESGREDILEKNTIAALEAVPLESIRKFARRTGRFADAYRKGLDGAQAAWACRKYKGHRGLPPDYLKELNAAGIRRGGNENVQM